MIPWLDQPVMLHSDRDPGVCTMTPEQCAYKSQYWVNWYQADHRFALPTVAFFMVAIGIFTIAHIVSRIFPSRLQRNPAWCCLVAVCRFLSYKSWRFAGWNSQSLGAFLLGAAGLVFFFGEASLNIPWKRRRLMTASNDPGTTTILLAQYPRNQLWQLSPNRDSHRIHGASMHAFPSVRPPTYRRF